MSNYDEGSDEASDWGRYYNDNIVSNQQTTHFRWYHWTAIWIIGMFPAGFAIIVCLW